MHLSVALGRSEIAAQFLGCAPWAVAGGVALNSPAFAQFTGIDYVEAKLIDELTHAFFGCSVVAGERAMSSAVITEVDAPTMPCPSRLAVTDTTGSSVTVCAVALRSEKLPSAIAPASVNAVLTRMPNVLRLRRQFDAR